VDIPAVISGTTASFLTADETKLDAIEALADVTDAANVDAAGAVMNADTTTASMSFVIDEDSFASDLATKVPTQQSAKAYVATAIDAGPSELMDPTMPPYQLTDNWVISAAELGRGYFAQADTFLPPDTTIALVDFFVPYPFSIDALTILVGTLDVGGLVRLGLFQMSADWSTHTLLVDAGTVDTDTAVGKTATFTAVPVTRGWYQYGVIRTTADSAMRIRSFTPTMKVYGGFNGGGQNYNISASGGYRTIPHAGTASTPFASSYGTSNNSILVAAAPAVFMRIQR
jgi:hypothetical protein